MSSTGRGPRMGGPEDFFRTPSWTVRRLLEVYKPRGGLWVEPGAGDGAIIRAVNSVRSDVRWVAIEIREEERARLEATGATVYIDSFIDSADPSDDIAVVIGNPPFKLAMEFLEHSRAIAPNADICFQLRLNFVGSEERADFMRRCPPDVKSLPNRPSYFLRQTDSPEYAWLIWPPGERAAGSFQVLASTSIEERQRDMPEVAKCTNCRGYGWFDRLTPSLPIKRSPAALMCPGCFGFGKVEVRA